MTAAVGRTAYVVAAADSSTLARAQADLVCDGVDDDIQLQTAGDLVNSVGGGEVRICHGNFVTGTAVSVNGYDGVHFIGEGADGTVIQAVQDNTHPIFIATTGDINDCSIGNMTIGYDTGSSQTGHAIHFDVGPSNTMYRWDIDVTVKFLDASHYALYLGPFADFNVHMHVIGGGGFVYWDQSASTNGGDSRFYVDGTVTKNSGDTVHLVGSDGNANLCTFEYLKIFMSLPNRQ